MTYDAPEEDAPKNETPEAEVPTQARPEITQNQHAMLGMLAHLQREVMAGRVEAVSFVLVPSGSQTPQHGYVANPFASTTLLAGFLMAQAELIDFVRRPAPGAPVEGSDNA